MSSLGDAESSLSDAKSSLSDAKSSLGDAQVAAFVSGAINETDRPADDDSGSLSAGAGKARQRRDSTPQKKLARPLWMEPAHWDALHRLQCLPRFAGIAAAAAASAKPQVRVHPY
jgi:hypothetical protein